jgi:enterobactin synthetase component D
MIEAALRRLFPSPCAVAVRAAMADADILPPVEAAVVRNAVLKRRQEFTAGREAARDALRQLGFVDPVIPRGDDRAPRWPEGAVGSIAHSDGQAVAVVARAAGFCAIGVDLERDGAVGEHLWPQIFGSGEIVPWKQQPMNMQAHWATVAFCAKEAFYKFQYPVTRSWREFADVQVAINFGTEELTIQTLHPVRINSTEMYNFQARFAVADTFVLVGLYSTVSSTAKGS